MAEDVISNLKIVATAESRGVETSLGAIAASLEKLKTSVSAGTANNIRKTGTAIADLARNIKIISLSDVSKMERLADALGRIKGYGSITRTVKVRYKEDTSSLPGGTSEGGAATPGSSTISTDVSPYLNGAERDAYMRSNGMYEGEKAIKAVGTKVKLFQSKLLSSLGRIAMYRAIRSAIKAVSEAFSEGYENAKNWAKTNDERLYSSVLKVKAATSEMKNQLGAAGLELTNAIAPALIKLAGVVTNIADRMSEFFATLDSNNDGTYLKAKKVTKEMMKQTEELKRQILGFDEINKLNGNNGGYLTEDDLFEKAPIDKSRATLTTVIVGAISMALGVSAGFKLIDWLTKIEVAILSLKASSAIGSAAAGAGAAGVGAGAGAAASGAAGAGAAAGAGWAAKALPVLGVAGLAVADAVVGAMAIKDGIEDFKKDVEQSLNIKEYGAGGITGNGTFIDISGNEQVIANAGIPRFDSWAYQKDQRIQGYVAAAEERENVNVGVYIDGEGLTNYKTKLQMRGVLGATGG